MATHSKLGGYRKTASIPPSAVYDFFRAHGHADMESAEFREYALQDRFRITPAKSLELAQWDKRNRYISSLKG